MALCPFLFVGCWNSPYNKNATGDPFFKRVVAAINKEAGISRLVLGGDNIYPEKVKAQGQEKKKKVYYVDKLIEGIRDITVPTIYAALGNHNIDQGDIEAYELNPKVGSRMYAPYKPAPASAGGGAGGAGGGGARWIMPDYNYVIPFTDYNLVVIDTNAVEDEDRLEALRLFLENTLAAMDKPYFLVQHEPFFSIRKNDVEYGEEIHGSMTPAALLDAFTRKDALQNHKKILDTIIASGHLPTAILCADTHNYQHGVITYRGTAFNQYVVGTGGASPDPLPDNSEGGVFTIGELTYVVKDTKSAYGYLRINDDVPIFKKVSDWSGGARTRRRRRRSRRRSRRSIR